MRVLAWLALVASIGCSDRGATTASHPPSTPVRAMDAAVVRIVPPASDAATLTITPRAPADVTLVLAPTCAAGSDVPSGLAVALTLPLAGRPVFRIDDNIMGTAGTAALISDEVAEDSRGALPIDRRVRAGVLELTPARDAVGTITLRYRVRSISTVDDGAREGVRHDATGVGGHGRHFLVLPDSQRRFRMRVEWAAPQCPATTRGAGLSSFGDAAPVDTVGELASLREAAYFYGRPQRTAADDGTLHLRTAWFGEPALAVAAAGAWAAKMFAVERAFFADDEPETYSIIVRVLAAQDDRANGIGQAQSFLSAIGPRTTIARRLKTNIAHEMLHRWLGLRLRLGGTEGTAYWFTEGFTVHFSNRLAFRAGLLSMDEYLEGLNFLTSKHFDNPRITATNATIARDFYRDADLSVVPYTRGALYAAELDAAIRRASQGQRTLDDLLRELYVASRAPGAGAALPADAVRKLVVRELGRAGAARYDAVIVRGGHPRPPPEAYGPCFTQARRNPSGFAWQRVPGIADATCRAW